MDDFEARLKGLPLRGPSQGLDERIGIKRVAEEHTHPIPLGDYEPSLGALLRDRADRWGDKVYMRYRIGDREYAVTWREFADRTSQIARHLLDQGIRPGDRIGVISGNRSEVFMLDMAVMSIGAVKVPIFSGYHPPQVAYVLRQARPRYVVVSGKHQLEKIGRENHPWVERYFAIDFDEACDEQDPTNDGADTDGDEICDLGDPCTDADADGDTDSDIDSATPGSPLMPSASR